MPADDLINQPEIIESEERSITEVIILWFIEMVVFSNNEDVIDIGAVDCEYSFIQEGSNCKEPEIPIWSCSDRIGLCWEFKQSFESKLI